MTISYRSCPYVAHADWKVSQKLPFYDAGQQLETTFKKTAKENTVQQLWM